MSCKTKFSPEIAKIIIESLRENPSIASAAVRAGVTDHTVRNWLAKGEQGDPVYEEFTLEAATARAAMKDEIVQSLFEIATDRLHPQAVKAAQELLRSLYPKEFSSVRHVVSHQAQPEELDLAKLPSDELRQLRKTLMRLRSDGEPEHTPKTENVITVLEANTGTSSKAN